MADVDAQLKIIQPLKENATPVSPRVFSMPARYRHGAVVSVVEPQKNNVSVVSAPVPPPVPVVAKPMLPPSNSNKSRVGPRRPMSGTHRAFIVAGGLVIVAFGIAGYLLFRSVQKNQPIPVVSTSTEVPVTTTPAVTPTEIPPAPTTPVEPTQGSTSPFASSVTPGVDSDSDGLTDVEETIVYGTNPHLPDTDGDGFLDGNEVFHHYNPNGTAPATLLGAKLVQSFNASSFILLYPAKWSVTPSDKGGLDIATTTGETFTVNPVLKDTTLILADWYAQNVASSTAGQGVAPTVTKSKNGFPMLVASNQLTAYLDLGTLVLAFTYDTATKTTIDYLQTFQMMLNSVEKK